MSVLSVQNLSVRFGGVDALVDVSLAVRASEVVGLIGPNGAGKTTFFNAVTGVVRPNGGEVLLGGYDVGRLSIEQRAALGLVRTFQHTRLFDELTVLENVRLGLHLTSPPSVYSAALQFTPRYRSSERASWSRAHDVLNGLGLAHLARAVVGDLAHGHQKLVGLAVAVATGPKCLLLDEPVAGMNAREVDRCLTLIRGLRSQGMAILIVEHNVHAVMSLADRVAVLNFGAMIAEGPPADVQAHEAVRAAYFGTGVGRQ